MRQISMSQVLVATLKNVPMLINSTKRIILPDPTTLFTRTDKPC